MSRDTQPPISQAAALALLQHIKADLTATDQHGDTPLHRAADEGNAAMVTLLLRTKVDINKYSARTDNRHSFPVNGYKYNRHVDTPLHRSTINCHTAVAKLLLDAKADPNAADGYDDKPLHKAARYNHAEIIALLVEHGAIVDIEDNEFNTPLAIAARNGQADAVKQLLTCKADIYPQELCGLDGSPDSQAIDSGDSDTVQLLIEAKAYINEDNGEPYTYAFTQAAGSDHIKLAFYLLRALYSADFPAFYWASDCSATMVYLLLKMKADVNQTSEDGKTALQAAVCRGDAKITTQLLQAKADVNQLDSQNRTAIFTAAKLGREDSAFRLVQAKANIFQKSQAGQTPLQVARENGHMNIVRLLNGEVEETETDDTPPQKMPRR
jgi:ankyrin repeat protein